jgi:hypothetical protein
MIDQIVITDKWGFVVLHSTETLYLYNVNGTRIKDVKLKAPILKWTAFTCPFGFDYIAFTDGDGQLGVFEAFYPENVDWRTCTDVVCLKFDSVSERLVVVLLSGHVRAFPVTFPSPKGPIPFSYS